jgi:hypothetical protein
LDIEESVYGCTLTADPDVVFTKCVCKLGEETHPSGRAVQRLTGKPETETEGGLNVA